MASSPIHLRLRGISLSYPGRRLLTDVSLTVPGGRRTGLIGENGAGKSTLLRIASGQCSPDAGEIRRPASIGFLPQEETVVPGSTIEDLVESAVAPVRLLEPALAQLSAQLGGGADAGVENAYDLVLLEAERTGLWSLDARISAVLNGLGLGDLPRSRLVSTLSGGQRRRLSLAALLLERPVALLLDEPTNHLDDDAVTFLTQELAGWPGPVLMASHDRWFLDAAATDLLDLDSSPDPQGRGGPGVQGRRYTGGYSAYLRERAAERRRWAEAWQEQQSERARLQHTADVDGRDVFSTTVPRTEARGAKKFYSDRAAKTVGGRVRSARRALAELDRRSLPAPPEPLRFRGPARPAAPEPEHLPAPELLRLKGAAVPGRLAAVDLVVKAGDRLLVEGANGSGKSTLLALLSGTLEAVEGSVERRTGVRIGMLAQEERSADLGVRAGDAYLSLLRNSGSAPSLTALGLLAPDAASRPLGELSPGQRRRVALAALMADPPDLLLLDEPTNHLALALAEELEEALSDYPGTMVLASHDRWLRRRWTGRRLLL